MAPVKPTKRGPATVAGVGFAAVLAIAAPFVALWEGNKPVGYADVIGIATACIGHTGPDVVIGQSYTAEECRQFFASDVGEAADAINTCVTKKLQPHEAAAVLSLAFNAGGPTVCKSTMVRLINDGQPATTWCEQFRRWVYAGKRKIQGLVNRREAERKLCLGQP